MNSYTHKIEFNIITKNGNKNDYKKCTSLGTAIRFKNQLEMNPLIRNIKVNEIEVLRNE